MDVEHTHSCCGAHELIGSSDIESQEDAIDALIEIAKVRYVEHNTCAFYIFTGVTDEGTCQEFAEAIRSERLGTVTKSRDKVNPNSENEIAVWIWAVNDNRYRKWAITKGIDAKDYDDDDDEPDWDW